MSGEQRDSDKKANGMMMQIFNFFSWRQELQQPKLSFFDLYWATLYYSSSNSMPRRLSNQLSTFNPER